MNSPLSHDQREAWYKQDMTLKVHNAIFRETTESSDRGLPISLRSRACVSSPEVGHNHDFCDILDPARRRCSNRHFVYPTATGMSIPSQITQVMMLLLTPIETYTGRGRFPIKKKLHSHKGTYTVSLGCEMGRITYRTCCRHHSRTRFQPPRWARAYYRDTAGGDNGRT